MLDERRRQGRLQTLLPLSLSVGGSRLDATLMNTGAGGGFLAARRSLEVGQSLTLTFGKGAAAAELQVLAQVVHVVGRGGYQQPGFGVRWLQAEAVTDAEALRHILLNLLRIDNAVVDVSGDGSARWQPTGQESTQGMVFRPSGATAVVAEAPSPAQEEAAPAPATAGPHGETTGSHAETSGSLSEKVLPGPSYPGRETGPSWATGPNSSVAVAGATQAASVDSGVMQLAVAQALRAVDPAAAVALAPTVRDSAPLRGISPVGDDSPPAARKLGETGRFQGAHGPARPQRVFAAPSEAGSRAAAEVATDSAEDAASTELSASPAAPEVKTFQAPAGRAEPVPVSSAPWTERPLAVILAEALADRAPPPHALPTGAQAGEMTEVVDPQLISAQAAAAVAASIPAHPTGSPGRFAVPSFAPVADAAKDRPARVLEPAEPLREPAVEADCAPVAAARLSLRPPSTRSGAARASWSGPADQQVVQSQPIDQSAPLTTAATLPRHRSVLARARQSQPVSTSGGYAPGGGGDGVVPVVVEKIAEQSSGWTLDIQASPASPTTDPGFMSPGLSAQSSAAAFIAQRTPPPDLGEWTDPDQLPEIGGLQGTQPLAGEPTTGAAPKVPPPLLMASRAAKKSVEALPSARMSSGAQPAEELGSIVLSPQSQRSSQMLMMVDAGVQRPGPTMGAESTMAYVNPKHRLEKLFDGPAPTEWPQGVPESLSERYGHLQRLGHGGLGVVYRAQDLLLDRPVVLKFMAQTALSSDLARRYFLREIKVCARLNHPNIVHIYDVGRVDGVLYYAMEFVEGRPLTAFLPARTPMQDWNFLYSVIAQLSEALDYAHQNNVLHRDVKPDNALVSADGTVKLFDFGLARAVDQGFGEQSVLIGTPHYMAPEQLMGGAVDPRTDQYALGIVLFRMITGILPFQDGNVFVAHATEPVPDPRRFRADLSPAVVAVILRMLAKKPDMRYDSCQQAAAALHGALFDV